MFEQKSYFAPQMFEQKPCFAPQTFEHKWLDKSLALHQKHVWTKVMKRMSCFKPKLFKH